MTQTLTTETLKLWRRNAEITTGETAEHDPEHIAAKAILALTAELLANRVMPDISSILVNDAAWKLYYSLTEHGPLNGRQFNNIKGCLYEALKIVMKAPQEPAAPDSVDVFADQVIGTKTKIIRMPAPLNVPQEGIRVYLNADELFMHLEKQGYIVEVSNE